MKIKRISPDAKKELKTLKNHSVLFTLIHDINNFKRVYKEKLVSENPSLKKVKAKGALISWAETTNAKAGNRRYWKAIEKKGFAKSDVGFFLKVFDKEKEERKFFRKINKDNEYRMDQSLKPSFRKAFIKKYFNKKFAIRVTSCVLAFVFLYPTVRSIVMELSRDKRPTASFTVDETLPNREVERDENGDIIEFPVKNEELIKAYEFLENKLSLDLKTRNVQIDNIDEIVSIFENEFTHEQDNIIEIIVKEGEKYYSLQYIISADETLNIEENDTRTISSFNSLLQRGILYSACEMQDDKQQILHKLNEENNIFVGDYYIHQTQMTQKFVVPVYSEIDCKLYSIDEKDVLREDDIYKELIEYLDGKNTYFTISDSIKTKNQYLAVLDACDNAHIQKLEDFVIELPIENERER